MIKDQAFALISLLIALLLMAFFALPVGASDMPDMAPAVQMAQSAEVVQSDTVLPQLEVNDGISTDESASSDAKNPEHAAENVQQEKPAASKSSNAPFLIGAVIAVLAFIGVAILCKVKGNQ